jgi:hypothetical protein
MITVNLSTSNNDVFEVLSHAANVLTVSSSPANPHSLAAFTAEAVLAGATVQRYTLAGFELSAAGLPIAIIDTVRQPIAYNTSSPTFAKLALTSVTPETTAFQILARSEFSNDIVSVDRELISGPNVSPVLDVITANIRNTAGTLLGTCNGSFVVLQHLQTCTVELSSFSVNLAVATNTIRIVIGDFACRRQLIFPILLNIDGVLEECFAIHKFDIDDASLSELVIARKNGTLFPVGSLTHGTLSVGLSGLTTISSHTYALAFVV